MNKAQMRKSILEWRNGLTQERVAEASERICQTLLTMESYRDAKIIMAYAAFGKEIDLTRMLERAWADGKKVLLPRVNKERKVIEACYVRGIDDLRPGIWGILEPKAEQPIWHGEQPIDVIYMPGLAFDREGHRLGYGGGYYDKFIASVGNPRPMLVAVAFAEQVVESVPSEPHDALVDVVVTEVGVQDGKEI
jgi:5-formyltetrahydrofolate cyclo-ligase